MNKEAFLEGYVGKVRDYLNDRKDKSEFENTSKTIKKALLRLQAGDVDIPVSSGLHRMRLKGNFKPEHLKKLGYFPSLLAVPERGQSQFTTWRQIDNNTHLHKHDKNWFMHQDMYPSLQAVLRRKRRNIILGKDNKNSILHTLKTYLQGVGHGVLEGIPGYRRYIESTAGNTPTFTESTNMGKDNLAVATLLGAMAD